ncbi:MAG: hypothetical protein KDB29_09505, partial [Planctomycetes bacterium]|nr:hypothetical protein [Planctomycetota bacterium]
MPRRYYEYVLVVRPHRRNYRGKTKKRPPIKPKTVRVVARSQFDAEWAFRCANPRMTVIEAKRGRQV